MPFDRDRPAPGSKLAAPVCPGLTDPTEAPIAEVEAPEVEAPEVDDPDVEAPEVDDPEDDAEDEEELAMEPRTASRKKEETPGQRSDRPSPRHSSPTPN